MHPRGRRKSGHLFREQHRDKSNFPSAALFNVCSSGMEQALVLLVTSMVLMVPGVQGTSHLSFANHTEVNITRDGCGVTKECVETPDNCDPAGTNECLFASLAVSQMIPPDKLVGSAQLRGDSLGYVAVGVLQNSSEGTTQLFICAQNNGSFFFHTMQLNSSDPDAQPTPTETRVTEIRGSVSGKVIRCEFDIPNVETITGSPNITFVLGSGSVNGTSIGAFNVSLTAPLNIEIQLPPTPSVQEPPKTTAVTRAPTDVPTTAAANTTPSSGASNAVHTDAVVLLSTTFTLMAMLRG
ncbi:uncharacterized protein ACBR49_011720 [Aulostomus maculatus]